MRLESVFDTKINESIRNYTNLENEPRVFDYN